MAELWTPSGGVNRKLKELYAASGGVNRKLKEFYAVSGGVNRKIFSNEIKISVKAVLLTGSNWSSLDFALNGDGSGYIQVRAVNRDNGWGAANFEFTADFDEAVEWSSGQQVLSITSATQTQAGDVSSDNAFGVIYMLNSDHGGIMPQAGMYVGEGIYNYSRKSSVTGSGTRLILGITLYARESTYGVAGVRRLAWGAGAITIAGKVLQDLNIN